MKIRFAPGPRVLALALLAGTTACSDIAGQSSTSANTAASTSNGTDGTASAGTTGDSSGTGTTTATTGGSTSGGGTDGTTGGTDGSTGAPPDEGQGGSGSTGGDACDDQTPVELFVSPDDSNSMSSPAQARETILNGWNYLSAIPIRTYEFFNYYKFAYPPAAAGEVAIRTSLYQGPNDPVDEYLLQVGLSSEFITNTARSPINVTLVLDTSGSMKGAPLDRMKDVARAIAASLKVGDKVSMVTWDTNQVPMLAGFSVTGPNDPALLGKIDALTASGGTDLNAGLEAGYDLANQLYASDMTNRVVLVSDGGANAGVTEIGLIAENAAQNGGDGVYLVGVGVGSPDTYKDELMDEVTDAGKGASVFIGSEQEAWKIFNQDFVSTFMVAARNVQIRLDLPPGFEMIATSAEIVSPDPVDVDPQHLAPSDAMVFHQRIRTCAPELVDDLTEITVAATFEDAVTYEAKFVTETATFGELLAANDPLLHKGVAIFAYAEALMAYKSTELLAEKKSIVDDALAKLAAAQNYLPQDPDLAEIETILNGL